ncbi:cubilin-like isoform X1 [Paramacrobiotus metropolitanus]|nr:cubilin-like isoform X1 [Paramacrobiotus metropolitanus]
MTFSNLGILLIVSCCIIYSHSSIPGQCGGEIDILPGRNYTFQTPGYPAQLAPNLRCDWILYTPEGYDVEFLGGEFEVDYTNYFPNIFSRSADYLYLSLDPPVPTNSTRFASLASGAQYVGNKAPEGVLFPNTNKLHATFITNDDNNHHFGFRIAIRAVSQPAPSASCNRNLTIGSDGAIIQYERKNPRETFCQWNIFIPQGAQTLLRVENLHLPIYLPEPLPYNDDRREYVVCEEEYLEIQEKDYGIVESSLAHNAGT